MYQRLIASLLKPKKIVDYVNDKLRITILYLLIFSMIFSLTYLLVFLDFDTNLKSVISNQLCDGETIEYVIQPEEITDQSKEPKGKLVCKLEKEKTYVVSFENTSFYYLTIVIGNDLSELKNANLSSNIIIQYATDGIYFCQASFIETKTKLMDYSPDNVDLSLIASRDLQSLRGVTKYIDQFFEQYKSEILMIAIPGLFVSSVGEILFTTLMSTIILLIFFKKFGIKFGTIYKVTLYCALPNVLGVLLTVLFSGFAIAGLFSNIGFIATTCYAMIALNELTRRNMKDKEENNYESI